MSRSKQRLVIADPSLADARGHHFSLSLQVTLGAVSQGVDVDWLTHADFVAPAELRGVAVHPIFSASMYDRYRPENRGNPLADLDRRLLEELNEGMRRTGLGPDDHIFFHTGYGDVYRAVAGYFDGGDWRCKPHLHVCTPYDLDTMPGKNPGTDLKDVFEAMRGLEAVDGRLFFWAETPQLARHYTAAYGFNVRALPLPVPAGLSTGAPLRDDAPVTVLYLGAAREEKGFLHLPELAARLHEPFGRKGRLRFVIQCTSQIIGYQPNIKQAIERLSHYPSSYVELIDYSLSEQEYFAHLAAADVVVLLYNRKNYRIRGSGIAVEAVCADKCLLTHSGTYCASLITHGGGAAVSGIDEAVEFLGDLVGRRAEYRQRAKAQGMAYRAENSAENYVARVLGQPDRAVPFFPSSVVGYVSPSLLKW